MKDLKNRVAAVTGAASGIGRATAVALARSGCHLALADVNEAELAATADLSRREGVTVTTRRVDVGDRAAVHAWADHVVAEHGRVHILINNAGVALGALVEHMRYEDIEWLMNINFWGVVHGTKAFLPHIKAAGEGHIVNLSSVFGLIGVPSQSAYNASKFAVKGFTEALGAEMDLDGGHIGVTCVHPGGVKTNIVKNSRMTETPGVVDAESAREFEKAFSTEPESAAEQIVKAIRANRRRLLIGADARVIDLMQRALPVAYQGIVVAGAKARRRKRQS